MICKTKPDAHQAAQKSIETGTVRVGPLQALPQLLNTHSQQPIEKIFNEVGIYPELLSNPENSISFEKVGELLEACVAYTGIPHFGLLLGQQARPSDLGKLSLFSTYAPDVRTALNTMILHICVHDRGGAPLLYTDRGVARFGYAIYEPIKVGGKHINDGSLAIMCNLLRAMCGNRCELLEVHLSHAAPEDKKPYENYYRAPVVFDADIDTLVFEEKWLDRPISTADLHAFGELLNQVEAIERTLNIGLSEKIHSIDRPMIVFQRCTMSNIANLLAMHPRTINRRLEDQGTTLRTIIGETRLEMAKHMLRDSNATITEISTFLGYSDSSVLTHLFRRWTGKSPSQWRESNSLRYRSDNPHFEQN